MNMKENKTNKISKMNFEQIEKQIAEDAEDLYMTDIIYGYHCNPSHIVPEGEIRIGIELESQRNTPKDILRTQVYGVSNCFDRYIREIGYENSQYAVWDSTRDSTASVEYVSRPIISTDAPKALQSIYSTSKITGSMETGNHFHVSKEDLLDTDVFGLLCVYLAPELKDASRRNFAAWNEWSSCRYKTLEDIDDMADSYFGEMRDEWVHPLVRSSNHCPTVELRCFTTSSKLSVAKKQAEAFLRIVDMSNIVAGKQYEYVDEIYLQGQSLNYLEDEFEDVCQEYKIYELLSEIAED